jgi:uncharacterized membrane protein
MVLGGSVAVRGVGRSLTLLGISVAVATAGELLGIRVARLLRHHSRPQVGELPAILPMAWYDAVAPAYGLASGFWEWRDGGAYVPDVRGANGVAGTPVGNYAGWLMIAGAVALLAERGRGKGEVGGARRRRTQSLAAHLTVAAPGLLWAMGERRGGLLTLAVLGVVGGAGAAWLAAGEQGREGPPGEEGPPA